MLSELISSMTWSVSELNTYVNQLLTRDEMLQGLLVSGEVSNFKRYPSGHWYFSLKDAQCAVRCVMFRQNNRVVDFDVRDGMHITVGGYASLYQRDGSFQLYVQTMRQEGAGALYERFEQLKQKLQQEGLFDRAHKRPIPTFPRRIGVVTSPAGAVIRDIVQVGTRRNPGLDLLLVPVSVQGDAAVPEMVEALRVLNARADIDVIIIGRGGGSVEDLWAFNEEALARAVYESRIPVISAVGHETDTTICDYVADLRAPTPSAAAELAVPLRDEWLQHLDAVQLRMGQVCTTRIGQMQKIFQALLRSASKATVQRRSEQLALRMQHAEHKLCAGAQQAWEQAGNRLQLAMARVGAYAPEQALKRGYVMLLDAKQKPIPLRQKAKEGQRAHVIFYDGEMDAVLHERLEEEKGQ